MLKNKEVRELILIEIIVLIIGIVSILLLNKYSYETYKEAIIENNLYIIDSIISKHPELENEVIDGIINHDISKSESYEILNKYGLDRLDTVDYLNNNSYINKTIRKYNIIYISILIIIVFSILIIYINKIYNKIRKLSIYTNDILNNKYNMDIREYSEGDISNLKNDLYKMTIKLKEQNELSLKDKIYLQDTLSDISHQLKTPLTSMYVINELLYDDKLDKSLKKELLNKSKKGLERIEWLITSLLKMSRLDSGSEKLILENVKLINIINKTIEPIRIPLELKNINLNVSCSNDIKVNVDVNWTTEALINILKNAMEHTLENGNINIVCSDNPLYTMISISDDGCGISKKDLPHIFERFYKGMSNKESIGIGLNMSKKIIENENGNISVKSKENEGTTFIIKLFKNNY
ncbi:MAG: HAMP domain-containing histidine kinase [Bacilli bacterium]|nr:HAMP domain-containing histidine kinase [Bacilli bacterium]